MFSQFFRMIYFEPLATATALAMARVSLTRQRTFARKINARLGELFLARDLLIQANARWQICVTESQNPLRTNNQSCWLHQHCHRERERPQAATEKSFQENHAVASSAFHRTRDCCPRTSSGYARPMRLDFRQGFSRAAQASTHAGPRD